jgi:type I restriction-modification system DNA methylase subunit
MNELTANRLLAWVFVFGGGNEALTHNLELITQVKEAKKHFDLSLFGEALDELCFNYSIFLPYKNKPEWCKDFTFAQDKKHKETGSFYTPPLVVYWICQMTFENYEKKHKNIDFENFTILEPSCGSGAFCVGMLQYLHDKFGNKALKYIYPMFGYDINAYAVEITKLRVWLFYIMRIPILEEQYLDAILENHFLVKNTLLENTAVSNGLFGNPNPIQKYDLIIGNPPYIQIQKLKDQQKDFEKQNFKVYSKSSDIYCLFYEKGMQLLKPNGILAYITSNKWLRAGYGEVLRNYFLNYNPLELIDFGGVQIFGNATVDTNILVVQNAPFNNEMQAINMTKEMWKGANDVWEKMQNDRINMINNFFNIKNSI